VLPLDPSAVAPVTGLPSGNASAIDGSGAISPVGVEVIDGRHVLTSGSIVISVKGDQPSEVSPSQVSPVLTLRRGETTEIDGHGFSPGSLVRTWLFSDPTLLGEAVADATGSFRIAAQVPSAVAAGGHTIVVSGVRADGSAEALALGVNVVGANAIADGMLPVTGVGSHGMLLASLGLVGVGTMLATRRRRAS
jgi:hypothetical protein